MKENRDMDKRMEQKWEGEEINIIEAQFLPLEALTYRMQHN